MKMPEGEFRTNTDHEGNHTAAFSNTNPNNNYTFGPLDSSISPQFGPSPSFPSSSNVDPKPNSFSFGSTIPTTPSSSNADSNPNSFSFGSALAKTPSPFNVSSSPNNFAFGPTFTQTPSPFNVDPKPNIFSFGATYPKAPNPFNEDSNPNSLSFGPTFPNTPNPFTMDSKPDSFSFGPTFLNTLSPFDLNPKPNSFSFGHSFTPGETSASRFEVCQKCGHNCMWGQQQLGSQGKAYAPTPAKDPCDNPFLIVQSISAMPFHQHKSHEELRWEHYQSQPLGYNNINGSAWFNAFTMGRSRPSLVLNGPVLVIPLQVTSYFPPFPYVPQDEMKL